jgi:hypothetical protein
MGPCWASWALVNCEAWACRLGWLSALSATGLLLCPAELAANWSVACVRLECVLQSAMAKGGSWSGWVPHPCMHGA